MDKNLANTLILKLRDMQTAVNRLARDLETAEFLIARHTPDDDEDGDKDYIRHNTAGED